MSEQSPQLGRLRIKKSKKDGGEDIANTTREGGRHDQHI